MSEWWRTRLGELLPFKYGKGLPQRARSRTGEYAVVSSAGFIDSHSAAITNGASVVIGRKGSIGTVFYCPEPVYPIDTTFYVEPNDHIDIRYAFYLLSSLPLKSMDTDAAVPGLNRENAERLPVSIPPLTIQKSIVDVLGTIDDLIENNRRRIELLESMARAIYREWFVHFRFPGHEDVPMVDSDLGLIPEGWKVKTIEDVSEVVTRGVAPKYADEGEWVVINQRCIRNEKVSFAPSRRQERPVPEAKRVQFGDILINSTGVGTLGRVGFYRSHDHFVTVDTHVTIVRPKSYLLNPWFGLALGHLAPTFEILGKGSTGQTELGRTDINAQGLVSPPEPLMATFAEVAWPILNQVDQLLSENLELANLRDLLLPKLVSGEIDVSNLDIDLSELDLVS